jgi:hypothetical protein
MKKILKLSGVALSLVILSGCGFIESSPSPETLVPYPTSEEIVSGEGEQEDTRVDNEQISTEGVELTEELQVDGKIIFKPVFTKTETGGVETILLEPGASISQIETLQKRLKGNATMQENGLAKDPVSIYGADIPGIAKMGENRDKYETIYKDLPLGGSVEYKSSDPAVIKAIHEWVDYSNRTYREDDFTPEINPGN